MSSHFDMFRCFSGLTIEVPTSPDSSRSTDCDDENEDELSIVSVLTDRSEWEEAFGLEQQHIDPRYNTTNDSQLQCISNCDQGLPRNSAAKEPVSSDHGEAWQGLLSKWDTLRSPREQRESSTKVLGGVKTIDTSPSRGGNAAALHRDERNRVWKDLVNQWSSFRGK